MAAALGWLLNKTPGCCNYPTLKFHLHLPHCSVLRQLRPPIQWFLHYPPESWVAWERFPPTQFIIRIKWQINKAADQTWFWGKLYFAFLCCDGNAKAQIVFKTSGVGGGKKKYVQYIRMVSSPAHWSWNNLTSKFGGRSERQDRGAPWWVSREGFFAFLHSNFRPLFIFMYLVCTCSRCKLRQKTQVPGNGLSSLEWFHEQRNTATHNMNQRGWKTTYILAYLRMQLCDSAKITLNIMCTNDVPKLLDLVL